MKQTTLIALTILLINPFSNGLIKAYSQPPKRPSVIIFIADDLGYGELSCQGNPQIPTPNIDAIAENGIRFTSGYVTAPNCSPSRAGFMTGKIPTRFGYEFNPIGARNEDPGTGLPMEQETIAEIFKNEGYATGLIGKWHLGGTADFHPMRRGFDEFFGFLHEGHYYAYPWWEGVTSMLRVEKLPDGGKGRWMGEKVSYYTALGYNEPPYDANNPVVRGSQPVVEHEYLTDAFTREGISFIERHRNQPFLLVMSYNAVHSPMQGADKYMEMFSDIEDIQRRIFAAMLANMDSSVGTIMERLRDSSMEENTIVIFFSDNGGPTLELTSSNTPLKGGKGSMYEGGIRIPFMIQWKNNLPAGKIYKNAISSMDLLPTLSAAAGIEYPADLDGINLLPYLSGDNQGNPHELLFWRQGNRTALRKGEWKLVRNSPGKWELFNLEDDMEEKHELSGEYQGIFNEILEEWNAMNDQMIPAVF